MAFEGLVGGVEAKGNRVGPPIHDFFIRGVNQPWVKNIQGREGVQKVPRSKTLIFHMATSLFSATPHSTWDLCSPTRDCPTPLALERQSLSHWIASKVPRVALNCWSAQAKVNQTGSFLSFHFLGIPASSALVNLS